MEKAKTGIRFEVFLTLAMLLIVSGLSYLIFIPKFGYFNDDWYLMYSAGAKGAGVFHDIFSIDRPGRVLVMAPAYWLFGQNPLYYNLSAYLFRLLSAIGFYWTLDMLWPRKHMATASMALFFLIYPGFLSQPNAIDYQSHIVGLAMAMLSIAFSLRAILSTNNLSRALHFSLSLLFGWFYLWQMEWYIGFEFLRWASIFLLVSRTGGGILQKAIRTVRRAYPLILVPGAFLFWRILLFQPERKATDIDLQIGPLIQSPLATGLRWLGTLFNDILDVIFLAWGQPLSMLMSWVGSWNLLLLGLGMSIASAVVVLVVLQQVTVPSTTGGTTWKLEALVLGLSGVIAGLIPIVLVNRYVEFSFYSRYTLVSSAGAAIFLVSLIFLLDQTWLKKSVIILLVFLASFTHFANSQRAAQVTQLTREFWWQVHWRIPQLEKGTTIVANYALGATEEDYFVWGPANLIYYPEGINDKYVQPGVYAAILNQNTIDRALLKKGQEFDNRRTIRTYKNYRRLLVLSQPTSNSCVHVIGGMQPEYSADENASILTIGPFSNFENISVSEPAPSPPAVVFGPEPEHNWCYFYQKASLARQLEAWDEVRALGEQALDRNLKPGDPIEWMPFLQAYAQEGDIQRLEHLASDVVADPYVASQACQVLSGLQGLSQQATDAIQRYYCIE